MMCYFGLIVLPAPRHKHIHKRTNSEGVSEYSVTQTITTYQMVMENYIYPGSYPLAPSILPKVKPIFLNAKSNQLLAAEPLN